MEQFLKGIDLVRKEEKLYNTLKNIILILFNIMIFINIIFLK